MKSVLASIAALALLTASAAACPFMKSAEYKTMSVASLDDASVPMSTTEDALHDEPVVDEVTTGAIESNEEETAE